MKIFVIFCLAAACVSVGHAASADPQPLDDQSVNAHTVDVSPVRTGEGAQSLNGEWRFKYIPSIHIGDEISSRFKAESLQSVAGKFTLLPLTNDWPAPLTNWFGAAGAQVKAFKPFMRSYDQ